MCQLARQDKENELAVGLHRNLSIVAKSLVDLLKYQVDKNERQLSEQAKHFAVLEQARQRLEDMLEASLVSVQQRSKEATHSMHNMQTSMLGIVSHVRQQAASEAQSMLGEIFNYSRAMQHVRPSTPLLNQYKFLMSAGFSKST